MQCVMLFTVTRHVFNHEFNIAEEMTKRLIIILNFNRISAVDWALIIIIPQIHQSFSPEDVLQFVASMEIDISIASPWFSSVCLFSRASIGLRYGGNE